MTFVSNTCIFARPTGGQRQFLAYQMHVGAPEDLAMILPLPVPAGAAENAVKFINLEGYDQFFRDLERLFPAPRSGSRFSPPAAAIESAPKLLKVEEVGRFVASFVPTVRDFSRLDPRFCLPNEVWPKLGQYAHYGFAVFQLEKGTGPVHPMAFSFPSAKPDHLFFPTVHIHDGKVHPQARFDHTLYCQVAQSGLSSVMHWEESETVADRHVDERRAKALVAGNTHVLRRQLRGNLPNEDTWLRVA